MRGEMREAGDTRGEDTRGAFEGKKWGTHTMSSGVRACMYMWRLYRALYVVRVLHPEGRWDACVCVAVNACSDL